MFLNSLRVHNNNGNEKESPKPLSCLLKAWLPPSHLRQSVNNKESTLSKGRPLRSVFFCENSEKSEISYTKTTPWTILLADNRLFLSEMAGIMIQEKRLMMRFNRGDVEALRDIYALYKDELVSLAGALLHNRNSAEDAVQDVFAKLIQKQDRLKITQNLRRYLMTSVANTARQYFSSRNRTLASSLDAEHVAEIGDEHPPESSALFDEQKQQLANALSALPYEQREVLLLRHFSDFKFTKIASLQNVSINTVQGRYRYGLDKLRSLLNGELK
jgi:RNA polymerase sigma-70 factor (ECF subfamily)